MPFCAAPSLLPSARADQDGQHLTGVSHFQKDAEHISSSWQDRVWIHTHLASVLACLPHGSSFYYKNTTYEMTMIHDLVLTVMLISQYSMKIVVASSAGGVTVTKTAVRMRTPRSPSLSGPGAVPSCSSWPARSRRTLTRSFSSTGKHAAWMRCLGTLVSQSTVFIF